MNNYQVFMTILKSSKAYEFDGSILTLTGYYTGEEVKLDLSLLDEDVFEQLIVEEDEDDYYE